MQLCSSCAAAVHLLLLLSTALHADVAPVVLPICTAHLQGEDGGTTIDQGSCMFGHIDPNKGTGLDIAALSDNNPDYKGESSMPQHQHGSAGNLLGGLSWWLHAAGCMC